MGVGWADDALTDDGFLGGRLNLLQPRDGYRAGIDPVLLAAAVPARAGQTVLELGCGAGTALLCVAARVAGLTLSGVERQADYADLARRNAARNGIDADIVTADIATLPAAMRQRRFDHVIANPPWFDRRLGPPSGDTGREGALAEVTPLDRWVDVASRRLAPRGRLTMIHRADRLPDLLAACPAGLGGIEALPILPREGRDATLVILTAVKGGHSAFRLRAPLVLHHGVRHSQDGAKYGTTAAAVLRDAAPLMPLAENTRHSSGLMTGR